MSKKWTREDVIGYLQEVVDERGEDYVYKEDPGTGFCMNSTPEGESSCIVGVVLKNHAPETFELVHKFEWEDWDEVEETGFCELPVHGVPGIGDLADEDGLATLATAQTLQDNGVSYGKVMREIRGA